MAAKRKRSIILRLLVIAVCCYAAVTLIGLWRELGKSQAELEALNREKANTEAKIEEYRALLSDGSQKAIVEKAARERFGYAYPGEEIYKEIN